MRIALAGLIVACGLLACVTALQPVHLDTEIIYGFLDGGDVWLGTARSGIFVVDLTSGATHQMVEGRDIPLNSTTCGASAFGRIWLGSDKGLWVRRVSDAHWTLIESALLPSTSVKCLEVQGSFLWVGTNKGVARYSSEADSWRTYTTADGLSDNWVLSMDYDGESMWFGTIRGGVSRLRLEADDWKAWGKKDGLPSDTVFSVSASSDYVLIGTTTGAAILHRSNGSWMAYTEESLGSPTVFSSLLEPQQGLAWIGTGKGLCILNPLSGEAKLIGKVGEIDLGRINGLADIGGAVWVMRGPTYWFAHKTTGFLGYEKATSKWVRPVVVDVLVDQSGYGPGDGKRFIVQCNEPLEGETTFVVESLAGRVVHSGVLGPRVDRVDWDAYYWVGDFSELKVRGNFTVKVRIGDVVATSFATTIDNEILLKECGELIYEFLRYMRCGVAHEFRGVACHLDDGVWPNGSHVDVTGGWHCAGIWGGKWSEYHTYVLFNLLLAFGVRSDFFGGIDRDGDGLPDILGEAMWGCDFLLKMQEVDGSIYHEVEKVEVTDNIIGTADDRKVLGEMSTYNGLLAVAGLAGTSALVRDRYPDDAARYLEGALKSFDYYRRQAGPTLGGSLNGATMALACAQLGKATGNQSYTEIAEWSVNQTLRLPFQGYYGPFVPCALGFYLELNPSTVWRQGIVDYIVDMARSRVSADLSASNPHLPFEIPTWALYIMDPWAAEVLFAYRLTGNRTYLDHALGLIDCHLGVNPYGICMLEGTGTFNPPGYTSSFISPSNPRGAVPGSIPQGIYTFQGRPYYQMSLNPHYETGETWLINTNFLQSISLLPPDTAEYPIEVPELSIDASWAAMLMVAVGLDFGSSLVAALRKRRGSQVAVPESH